MQVFVLVSAKAIENPGTLFSFLCIVINCMCMHVQEEAGTGRPIKKPKTTPASSQEEPEKKVDWCPRLCKVV